MPPRILVVDDEARARELVVAQLASAGYESATADDGGVAVERVERERFDLVLMDYVMPLMDGIDACQAIRRTSDVPIVFLTAVADAATRIRAMQAGGDGWLVKPVERKALLEKVAQVLSRRAVS